jgi:hypothetical protein
VVRVPGTAALVGHSPLVKVDVVVGNGRRLQATAVLDSGADRTVVPLQIVEALGVEYDMLKMPIYGNGEPIRGQGADGDFEIRTCRGKVRWRTTTICTEFWVANCGFVLLGRDDFFKKFDVVFDWSAPDPYVDIEPAGTMRALAAFSPDPN